MLDSDWDIRSGVKMTPRDDAFDIFSPDRMIEKDKTFPSTCKDKLAYTPHQRAHLASVIKMRQQQVEKVLDTNRKGLERAKMERDLEKGHPNRIRNQDLTFFDRQRRFAQDDVSIDSKDPDQEFSSDWTIRTGVKMSTRDTIFANLSVYKMGEFE